MADIAISSLIITPGNNVIVREHDNTIGVDIDLEHNEGKPITEANKFNVTIIASSQTNPQASDPTIYLNTFTIPGATINLGR